MKLLTVSFAAMTALLLTSVAFAAMPGYQETVIPKGHDAQITAVWKGAPEQGAAILPVPAKAKLGSVSIGSTPAETYTLTKIDGDAVLSVPLGDASAPVTVTAVWTLPGLFIPPAAKASDEGPTRRGDLSPLNYGFTNTTPRNFAKAELTLLLPQEQDLFQIVSPAKAKFSAQDGVYTVSFSQSGKGELAGLARGGKVNLSLVLIPKERGGSLLLWISCVLLGGLFLALRRNIIAQKDVQA